MTDQSTGENLNLPLNEDNHSSSLAAKDEWMCVLKEIREELQLSCDF